MIFSFKKPSPDTVEVHTSRLTELEKISEKYSLFKQNDPTDYAKRIHVNAANVHKASRSRAESIEQSYELVNHFIETVRKY